MFDPLQNELVRLKAHSIELQPDESRSHTVNVTIENEPYSITPRGLLQLLKSLPDGATEAAIKEALEMRTAHYE